MPFFVENYEGSVLVILLLFGRFIRLVVSLVKLIAYGASTLAHRKGDPH